MPVKNNEKMGKDDSIEGCFGEYPRCKVIPCYHKEDCIRHSKGLRLDWK